MAAYLREQLLARGLAPQSVNLYARTIENAEAWFEGHGYKLRTASATAVAEFLASMPTTWANRNLHRAALKHYWEIKRRKHPPIAAIRVPRQPKMVCRAISPSDAELLAKTARARGDCKGLATAIGLYLGIRRAEIARMRWENWAADGWVKVVGKGDVEVDKPTHPLLLEMLAVYPHKSRWVFPGRVSGHVSPATIWTWVLEVAEDAGVGHVTPHLLRHTCLATANDNTGDLRAVQEFAGHAKPETTAIYTRATAKRLTSVVEALDY